MLYFCTFWGMCQNKLGLAVLHCAHGEVFSSPLTSGIFVVGCSLWSACSKQMGTLCSSCLHVMTFLAHGSKFLKHFFDLWASLKTQCIPRLQTDTFYEIIIPFDKKRDLVFSDKSFSLEHYWLSKHSGCLEIMWFNSDSFQYIVKVYWDKSGFVIFV